jgi:hypothetical protein
VKERSAQLSAAELALQLTKAKVSAAVKNTYFESDRSRQLSELAHRMASTLQIQRAGYSAENPEIKLTRARLEVEMLQAGLEYRRSLAQGPNGRMMTALPLESSRLTLSRRRAAKKS